MSSRSTALKSWVGGGEGDGVSWAVPTMRGDWGEDGDGVGRNDRTSSAPRPQEDAHVHLHCLGGKEMHNVQVVFCKLSLHES
jgi:hypothetical protein